MHRISSALILAVSLTGCIRGCPSRRPPIHLNPNMDVQPRYRPQAESGFFASGATSQLAPTGTIARGELPLDPLLETGRSFFGGYVPNPLPEDEATIARGRDRFQIYCVPCHGASGDGRGKLWERSRVESANLLERRLRDVPDGRLFEVVTDGEGLMQGYRYPLSTEDRWAIVAYVRQLQRGAAR